jgi:hypothetical protein
VNVIRKVAMMKRNRWSSLGIMTVCLLVATVVAKPSGGLAQDGGGFSQDEATASVLGQVTDLLGNGQDLNGEGLSDLLQHDGDLHQTIDLLQTQVPGNAGEVTVNQMEQSAENRSSSSSKTERRQSTHPRNW